MKLFLITIFIVNTSACAPCAPLNKTLCGAKEHASELPPICCPFSLHREMMCQTLYSAFHMCTDEFAFVSMFIIFLNMDHVACSFVNISLFPYPTFLINDLTYARKTE
jgi:hypothetical protein